VQLFFSPQPHVAFDCAGHAVLGLRCEGEERRGEERALHDDADVVAAAHTCPFSSAAEHSLGSNYLCAPLAPTPIVTVASHIIMQQRQRNTVAVGEHWAFAKLGFSLDFTF
jgi:hypothetical protein